MNAPARTAHSPSDRLSGYDFERHNAEVREVWAAMDAGRPIRTPIILGTNSRYFMKIPDANASGWEFRRYSEDPDTMFDALLTFQRWSRFNLLQDAPLGLPDEWAIGVDFQNYSEAAWLGCPIRYFQDQVPDVEPIYSKDPERVMENGIPDPFSGIYGRGLAYHERFQERTRNETYLGKPIRIDSPFLGTDGIMTLACNIAGADFVCTAMAGDPKRLHGIFDFLTEATIARMKAWRELAGTPIPEDGFGFADDSIALISPSMYREHVLPYHRRIFEVFATDKPRSIHLCGDATRHFKTLRDELNIYSFDTGFPVDFGWLRESLGPEVLIHGGPRIDFLKSATPLEICANVRVILESGILKGGRFVLREGNNLAPETPVENTEAMYRAGCEFGTPDRFV